MPARSASAKLEEGPVLERSGQVRRLEDDPSRLHATRSAFRATAAVGSTCSRVRWSTRPTRLVGLVASSRCARTAIRRASSRCSGGTSTTARLGSGGQSPRQPARCADGRIGPTHTPRRGLSELLGNRGPHRLPDRLWVRGTTPRGGVPSTNREDRRIQAPDGLDVPWYSSADSDFNYDFHVTVDDRVTLVLLNYRNETELAEYGTADRSGGGPREPLQYEDLSRDSSTGSAGFARSIRGQSRPPSCRPDGREATAQVRSCSRRGRLTMRSGYSDPAPPAAQPQHPLPRGLRSWHPDRPPG